MMAPDTKQPALRSARSAQKACRQQPEALGAPSALSRTPDGSTVCAITLTPIAAMPKADRYHAQDGHVYERKALARWLANHPTSPLTRQPMPQDVLALGVEAAFVRPPSLGPSVPWIVPLYVGCCYGAFMVGLEARAYSDAIGYGLGAAIVTASFAAGLGFYLAVRPRGQPAVGVPT